MAITKTKFINYARCPRYVALDDLKKEKLDSMVKLEDYKKEEEEEHIMELLGNMFDGEGNDLIDVRNEHLETMMPYYNKVEILAGELASKYFKGKLKFSKTTYNQESFDAVIDNIRYLCYVDIYNENEDGINIIEVKATTTKKYLSLGSKDYSIFKKGVDGIYYLLEDLNLNIEDYMPLKVYEKNREKLFDRYSSCGHYIYDVAVQRFIIENDMKNHGENKNIKYYLAVLNSNYVFDGKYENAEPIYDTIDGEDIISYIDVTSITKDLMDKIYLDSKKIGPYQRLSDRNLFLILHIKKLNVHCFTIFIINGINNVLGMHIIFNNCFTITKSVLYTFVQVIKVYIITICIYKIELRILEVLKSICINFHDYASFRHYSNT